MDNLTKNSTVAVHNFQVGDRVSVVIHPIFAGKTGEVTALPSPDAGIVALDDGARERIPLSCLELVEDTISLISNDVAIATSFNVEVLVDAQEQMDEVQARHCVEQINACCNRMRWLLVDLEVRQGYLALGFASMSGLMKSDLFSQARSTLQLELKAGQIEKNCLNVPIGTFSESHLRPLSKLKPEYQPIAIEKAKQIAGDRAMTARDVSAAVATMLLSDKSLAKRSIVDVVKERNYIPLCDRSQCQIDDAIFVRANGNADLRPYNGYWGIIQRVSEYFYHIYISLKGEVVKCKEEEVEQIDITERERMSLLSVSSRVSCLLKAELEGVDVAILETIQRSLYLTPRQIRYLEIMEKDYGISSGA